MFGTTPGRPRFWPQAQPPISLHIEHWSFAAPSVFLPFSPTCDQRNMPVVSPIKPWGWPSWDPEAVQSLGRSSAWGVEIGVSPPWAALAIICILKKPRIGGLNFWSLLCPQRAPVQGVRSCGGSRPRSWHKGRTIPIPTCRDHSIMFNCQAGTSPFKLSSGVILHKVMPTCSFFFSVCIIAFL